MENQFNEPQGRDTNFEKEPLTEDNYGKVKKDLTFGQMLVGVTFNPSGDEKVNRAKEICAELADMVRAEFDNGSEISELKSSLYHHAIGEILNAQMNAVKVLTLKY